MLALPVLRSRVAPVLDWCSRWRIMARGPSGNTPVREVIFEAMPPHEMLRALREEGVTTLICGAVSLCLKSYGEQLGMEIVDGVSGEVQDVLAAYRSKQLHQRRFRLPGVEPVCRRTPSGVRRRWDSFTDNGEEVMPFGKGSGGQGSGQGRGKGSGQGGRGKRSGAGADGSSATCVCPQCKREISHSLGVPCRDMRCPQCDQPMVRK